jgi:lipoprotein-releasing system permease protein
MNPATFIVVALLVVVVGLVLHLIVDVGVWALLLRLFGPMLERTRSTAFVAVRHLRGKKSGVLAFFVLLSTLGVSVSSCMLSSVISIMGGFGDDLRSKIIGNNAHVVADRVGGTIDGGAAIAAKVRRIPGVIGAMPYVSGEVMISSQTNLSGVLLKGIDPRHVARVIDLGRHLEEGKIRYLQHPEELLRVDRTFDDFDRTAGRLLPMPELEPDASHGDKPPPPARVPDRAGGVGDGGAGDGGTGVGPPAPAEPGSPPFPEPEDFDASPDPFLTPRTPEVLPGVIIGRELAKNLRLHVADEVDIVSPLGDLGPTGPVPKSRPFRVAGIFYTGMYEFDSKFAYVTIPVAQSFLNLGERVTGVEARVEHVESVEQQARAIKKHVPRGVRVRDWKQLNRNLFSALALEKVAMFVALSVATIIAAFSIVSTLLLMVLERGREIAVLKALGASDAAILRIFMLEGLLIGIVGAAAGILIGALTCVTIKYQGVRLDPEVYYIDQLPVHMSLAEFALVGVAAVGISIIATLYPSYTASRLRPVDGLRDD